MSGEPFIGIKQYTTVREREIKTCFTGLLFLKPKKVFQRKEEKSLI